jgi:hypothetical protein
MENRMNLYLMLLIVSTQCTSLCNQNTITYRYDNDYPIPSKDMKWNPIKIEGLNTNKSIIGHLKASIT